MKVKSKFSSLSNWKEEPWKKSGLQRDLNPWPPRYRCDVLPTELWSHTLGARSIYRVHNLLRWSLFTFSHNRSSNQYELIHIYLTSFHCTGKYELDKLTSLSMCSFIAQLVEHRTGIAEITGSNPVEALIIFRLLLSNWLNWKIYCDDHSLSRLTLWQRACIYPLLTNPARY